MVDWYSVFNGWLIGPFIRRRVCANVTGRRNLPKTGGFILAMGSHTTEVESLIVAAHLTERKLHFYAKSAYWRRGGPKGRLWRWFMGAVGNIPVERGKGRAALKAIEAGVEVLRRGEVLAVYPEGTRVPDRKLHGAYPGTVHTLLLAIREEYEATSVDPRIPIVPVGLMNMGSVSPPKGGFRPQSGTVTINIGEPLYLSRTELKMLVNGGRPAQSVLNRELTRRMMHRIARLCGKEYDPHRLPIPGDN